MVSEAEVKDIVKGVASRLGVPAPRVSFAPAKVSFMPVMVMNGSAFITPAAREALSAEAIEFGVVQGLVGDTHGFKERGVRRIATVVIALLMGYAISLTLTGPARALIALLVTIIALVALTFASAAIQAKWPSSEIERRMLSVLSSLDGAREYAQTTERFNLSRDTPEEWGGPHGKLVDLGRLERVAREMGLPFV